LLVVIAIIAILAALLLPALATAKLKGQQTKCISNVKQMVTSGLMYVNDTGGFFAYVDPDSQVLSGDLWMGTLSNYWGALKVQYCPVTQNSPTPLPVANLAGAADSNWDWGDATPQWSGSYGLNGWFYIFQPGQFVGASSGDPNDLFGKPSALRRTSEVPLFFDAVWVDTWPEPSDTVYNPTADLYDPGYSTSSGMERLAIARHGSQSPGQAPRSVPIGKTLPGGIDIGFYDGHAQYVKLQTLWTYYWNLHWTPVANPPP
jgi:hypothetical protein